MALEEEVSRTIRDEPPTHFTLRINSFSLLSESSLERYDSGNFEAGGHKWKLENGTKMRKGTSLSTWKYANGKAKRFRATKTQSGFDRLITLKEFNDPSNGYLVNDTCVFGAEVFVHRESVVGKGECLSMTAGPVTCNHTWKIDKFSALDKESHLSEVFAAGGHKWRVNLWPKGNGDEKGKSLSLFLVLDDSKTPPPGRKVYVEFQLRVVDQIHGKHVDCKLQRWFNHPSNDWGLRKFLSLSSLRNQSNGYLVNDSCIIEAHLLLIGAIEKPTPNSK